MTKVILILALVIHSHTVLSKTQSRYIGEEKREIKSLSQQEVSGLLEGQGLGYAKAAELNSYPGPKHVLDLSEQLNLTKQQILQTQLIFNVMKSEAIDLGSQLIHNEKLLEQKFSSATIDEDTLDSLVSKIGTIQAKLRYVHLNTHIKQRSLLTEAQLDLYNELRGYNSSNTNSHMHHH